jgi:HSP20 family protein
LDDDLYKQNHYFQAIDSFFQQFSTEETFRYNKRNLNNVFIIKVELPGYKKKQISLRLIDFHLKITVSSNKTTRTQFIHLPCPVYKKHMKAKYDNGLLTIVLRKVKGKTIIID